MKSYEPYEPMAGEDISVTASAMVALANETKRPVRAKFNGIAIRAKPGESPDAIVRRFQDESDRRRDKLVNSPKYKKQQREVAEARQRQDLMLKDALAAAPETMTLKDEAGWNKMVAANTDPYGSATIRFTGIWARLMEGRMAHGDTLEACADEMSHLADIDGITGFMYGCAVSILAQVWTHGEQLRRWHNLKTQIGHEGEAANERGGVLNPALLNISARSR